jgi:hypothetical protein
MGLLLEITAIFMIVLLAREIIATLRLRGQVAASPSAAPVFAICWRLGAVALLVWFVSYESSVLQYDFAGETEIGSQVPGWGANYRLRQGLFPICALLAMLGLALGMGAGAILEESPRAKRRPYWLLVPLAGLAALLIVAQPQGPSLIPYLVLIAIEGVTNALRYRLVAGPGLSIRLFHAGIDASVAAGVCLLLALILARDFERARRALPWAESLGGRFLRLLVLMATTAAGLYIARVTMPAIQPALAEGFVQIIRASEVFMIVIGFGLFATGLAARTVTERPARDIPRSLMISTAIVRYGVLALVTISALVAVPPASQLSPGLPGLLTRAIDAIQMAINRMFNRLPDPFVTALFQWLAAEPLFWSLMMLGLAALILELAIRGDQVAFAPFDALAGQRSTRFPIVWLVAALVVLCLAVLPTLIVAGQVLINLRYQLEDWITFGW